MIKKNLLSKENDKQNLESTIDVSATFMELIAKTCKALCSKRLPSFNIEIHQTYIMCTLYMLDRFTGKCTVQLSRMIV